MNNNSILLFLNHEWMQKGNYLQTEKKSKYPESPHTRCRNEKSKNPRRINVWNFFLITFTTPRAPSAWTVTKRNNFSLWMWKKLHHFEQRSLLKKLFFLSFKFFPPLLLLLWVEKKTNINPMMREIFFSFSHNRKFTITNRIFVYNFPFVSL